MTGSTGQAKDFWLEVDPANPAPKAEERGLHLRAGTAFKADEELPLQKERMDRFDLLVDRDRRHDLLVNVRDGQVIAAKLPAELGASLVVMTRREKPETLDAAAFNRFLADEGQEAVLAARTRAGQTSTEGRETVLRCLKTLVPGTDPASALPNTLYRRSVGQKLEVLLENNPGRLPANRRLAVKILFEGKPLAGAKVSAYRHNIASASGPAATPTPSVGTPPGSVNSPTPDTLTAVTSAQGLAEFKLDQNGPWLVRVVHVRAAVAADRKVSTEPTWESFWVTYTFVARNAPPPVQASTPSPSPKE